MKKIGLIDFDGKIPNLALMKLSSHFKSQGAQVLLNDFGPGDVDEVYCSVIFTKNRDKALSLRDQFPNITFGGTGYDLETVLPDSIESALPDFNLYQEKDLAPRVKGIMTRESRAAKVRTLLDAGIGFTTRGCVRNCEFCFVPKKEGKLHQVGEIASLINDRSLNVIILDNNFTADPDVLEKLKEIRERGLTIDITQGIDVRVLTPKIAEALSTVKHLRSIHYAWDLMPFEHKVLDGIGTLTEYVKPWRHACFVLVGFNTTFEEDMYRVRKLAELGVTPFVMIYNQTKDIRLAHFARWVNGKIFKKEPDFEQYTRWMRDRADYFYGSEKNNLWPAMESAA